LVIDSLISLSTRRTAFENITIDLNDLYNQNLDSLPIVQSSKKPFLLKKQNSVNNGLVNGNFSVNDFGIINSTIA
jgi:hypothetical protein